MKTHHNVSDNQLVSSFQQGNERALEVLLNRHKDKIFTSIIILVKDRYLAEDIFQDTFIKIIDTLHASKYNEEGKFLPWAIRIAHNLCVDHFRKVKRTPTITTNGDQDIFETLNVVEAHADSTMIKGQSHNSVRKLVDALPEDQREVLILRHYADLSFKEIAEMTNCSINTALGRMRYALMNMRKLMIENHMAL